MSSPAVLRRALRGAALSAAAASALGLAACGSEDEASTPPLVVEGNPTLVLQVSRSLGIPLTSCTKLYAPARVRVELGEAGELEGRIRDGSGDLLAADDNVLPQKLADDDVVEEPEAFARDQLVLAVPVDGAKIRDFSDLAAGDSTGLIGLGDPAVALGAATTIALERLAPEEREAVLARVRRSETDIATLVQQIREGELDGAIIHETDVLAADGRLRALPLPAAMQPEVVYTAAVVKDSPRAADAAALLDDLQTGTCAAQLRAAGFLAP